MMKKHYCLIALFCYYFGFAQNLESLKLQTRKICDANYTMDFDAVADLTYPKIYEALGRDAFVAKLDNDYQNESFRMRLQIEIPDFQYSDIKKAQDQSVCIISYKNPIRYFFENKMDSATGQQKAAELKASTNAYETIYEPKRNSINVKRNSKLIAISDAATAHQWKFINWDDTTQREAAQKLLNETIKKEFGL